jgi:hypothetical protein
MHWVRPPEVGLRVLGCVRHAAGARVVGACGEIAQVMDGISLDIEAIPTVTDDAHRAASPQRTDSSRQTGQSYFATFAPVFRKSG